MKLVITGSLGNISKPLVMELVQKGHSVTVISSKSEKQSEIESIGAKAAIGTLEDVGFLTETFNGADAVYCMLPPFNYFDAAVNPMVEAGRMANNYKLAIEASGVKRVIHLSSIGAHMEKGNGLLAFHHLAESILKQLPADVAIVHMRPSGFYYNFLAFKDMIAGKGFLGLFLTVRYVGLWAALTGKRGVIAANYGADDKLSWVSPIDIAAAIAEEITTPFTGRKVRYVASEDGLTCNDIAGILGNSIGKPYLKWALMSDKDMLGGLKMFGLSQERAEGVVEMNAAIHSGLVEEDYKRHRPKLGKVKMKDYAKDFAAAMAN